MPLTLLPITPPSQPPSPSNHSQSSDIQQMASVYFSSCSSNALSLACWPRTPEVREWWERHIRRAMEDEKNYYCKVVDLEDGHDNDGEGGGEEGEVVAWGKWSLVGAEGSEVTGGGGKAEKEEAEEVLPEGADKEVCRRVFGAWDVEREQLMGARRYWYLEQLFTSPQHQRRGAGGLIMKWGIQRADEDGLDAYLEASGSEGLGLYRKYGFEIIKVLDTVIESVNLPQLGPVEFRTSLMIRKPRNDGTRATTVPGQS